MPADRQQPEQDDLMEGYRDLLDMEYKLEQAVINAFGGHSAVMDGSLPFSDWYFDTYDSSVELTGARNGLTPSDEALSALKAAGIWCVYVSYEDGSARVWRWDRDVKVWKAGACSPRENDTDRRGLLRAAEAQAAGLREALRGAVYCIDHHYAGEGIPESPCDCDQAELARAALTEKEERRG